MMNEIPEWLTLVSVEAGKRLGLPGPLVFPPELITLAVEGIELIELEPSWTSDFPLPEFGFLAADMVDFYDDYEFSEWIPGAWPLALDGGGGFFCFDLRAANADGEIPVVWVHASNLGWGDDEAVRVAASLADLLSPSK
ncbi:hypothetical protein CS176_2813 [Corynebacterium glutamicum]|uniref:SMI1/KNR4 family protein n=1 Tax=Corynebacterium glutamicum TaxID=1718 RepID=UPI000979DAD8|nr:SMI1/KNR4 family protein [Corynebacterium glutamicum]GAV98583.1 hypothetical protein CS176_2813 [Corynebacterium glutamicum]